MKFIRTSHLPLSTLRKLQRASSYSFLSFSLSLSSIFSLSVLRALWQPERTRGRWCEQEISCTVRNRTSPSPTRRPFKKPPPPAGRGKTEGVAGIRIVSRSMEHGVSQQRIHRKWVREEDGYAVKARYCAELAPNNHPLSAGNRGSAQRRSRGFSRRTKCTDQPLAAFVVPLFCLAMEALSLSGCFEVKLLPAVIILENYGVSRPVKEKDFFTEGVGWVRLVVHMVEKKSWQAKAWLILEPSCYSTLIFTTSSARLSLFSRKCPLKRFLFFKQGKIFFFVSFFWRDSGNYGRFNPSRDLGESERIY